LGGGVGWLQDFPCRRKQPTKASPQSDWQLIRIIHIVWTEQISGNLE